MGININCEMDRAQCMTMLRALGALRRTAIAEGDGEEQQRVEALLTHMQDQMMRE